MTKPPAEILVSLFIWFNLTVLIYSLFLKQLFALQSMEKANEIITANQLQYTPQLDDKGHTLEQYSYDHFRFVNLLYKNRENNFYKNYRKANTVKIRNFIAWF